MKITKEQALELVHFTKAPKYDWCDTNFLKFETRSKIGSIDSSNSFCWALWERYIPPYQGQGLSQREIWGVEFKIIIPKLGDEIFIDIPSLKDGMVETFEVREKIIQKKEYYKK